MSCLKPDGLARDWLRDGMKAHGLQPAIDAIGNQFGLLATTKENAPVVMVCAHIES